LKGENPELDSYSAFADNQYSLFSSLSRHLFSRNITHVTIVGLALDYCVRATAIDARKFGFDVRLVQGGCRAVGGEKGGKAAVDDLRDVWKVEID
jgi:nicotinamidase-related amidase